MQSILASVLLLSIITTAKSQIWAGSFAVGPDCSTDLCCCFTGELTVTRPSLATLNIQSALGGQCGGQTTYQASIPYLNGVIGSIPVFGDILALLLSFDNRIILGTDPRQSACHTPSAKNGANRQYRNIATSLVALTLLQLLVNFAKI